MAPKGLYSVQKSRSFGGTDNAFDSPTSTVLSPDPGRKTPNFDSLRKKFSRKKTTSFENDEEGDVGDGSNGSSLRKKNKSKVGNILKWFKKENKEQDEITDPELHSARFTRIVAQQNSDAKAISVSSVPYRRSCSYDSICSVASAASSFAYVPVNAYKVGRFVEPKKKIAIGINCGLETYRKRLEQREDDLENSKELSLTTKYNLMSSDSPPTLLKKLPAGPILQSCDLHRNDDTNSSSSDTDTDMDTGSPDHDRTLARCQPPILAAPLTPAGSVQPQADQQRAHHKTSAEHKNVSNVSCSVVQQSIKPRELTGQHLYPRTIKQNNEGLRPEFDFDDRTLRFVSSREKQKQVTSNISRKNSDNLPKKSPADDQQQFDSVFQCQSSNPFEQFESDNTASSPRNSFSEDSDTRQTSHIPGKRRAPEPPVRSHPSPGSCRKVSAGADSQLVKKKGRAPQPPACNNKSEESEAAVLAGGQEMNAAVKVDNNSESSGMMMTAASAPSSPAMTNRCSTANDWVLQDGLLRSNRNSQQDIANCVEMEQSKVPLSPKPWYKRNILQGSSEKKQRDKKAKSPNLPEVHTSRDKMKPTESEDPYNALLEKIPDTPKSPKQFLRSKIIGSPRCERPQSRPISGLTGISDLDRQAAEIIRRKNEEEAAKRKEEDAKFYAQVENEGQEAQKAIDQIMNKLEGISKKNDWNALIQSRKDERENPQSTKVNSNNEIVSNVPEKKEVDIEPDFQHMGSVVSDLNSFLASTRKALSSPLNKKRSQQQQNENLRNNEKSSAVRNQENRTGETSGVNNNPPDLRMVGTNPSDNSNTLSGPEENPNYIPQLQSSQSASAFKCQSNFPPPPSQHSQPVQTTVAEKTWSCQRCTLINANNCLSCEACGAQRTETEQRQETFHQTELDTESEDAPPKPGNVLNKLLLFSTIDAKAKETPTLQRRRSAEIKQLSRTFSSSMLPIEENPLQKTLERIAEKQAELVKSKDCFNHNFFTSKDANAEKCNSSSQPSEDPQSKQNILMKQQQKLLEDAIINQHKQRQQEEVLDFSEKASTLPLGNVSSKAKTDNNISNENSLASQESQIIKSPSAIIPPQSNKEVDPLPRPEPIPSTSLKATFDFSKTPRSFLSSSTISQPTPKPWSKFNHNSDASRPQSTEPLKVKAAPKLEFLGSEVTRHLPAEKIASVESLEKNKSFNEKLSNGAVSVCFIIFVKIPPSKVLNIVGSA